MPDTTEVRPVDGSGHTPAPVPLAAMPHRRTPFDGQDPEPAGDPEMDTAYWSGVARDLRGIAESTVRQAFDWLEAQVASEGPGGATLIFALLDLDDDPVDCAGFLHTIVAAFERVAR